MEHFKKYEELLKKAMSYYCKDEDYITYFKKIPNTRDYTFKYCLEYINNINPTEHVNIVELGTSRSFVDGRFPGCNSDNPVYWEPNNPSVWDWSAGCFTRVFSECTNQNVTLNTLDLEERHIKRCLLMTSEFSHKINYHISSSEDFLSKGESESIDLLYLDTGDVNPIEPTALLHLCEAKIIIERNLLKKGGLILIDDVKNLATKKDANEKSDFGKAKYSIPFFLENGYEMVVDEYQVILKK